MSFDSDGQSSWRTCGDCWGSTSTCATCPVVLEPNDFECEEYDGSWDYGGCRLKSCHVCSDDRPMRCGDCIEREKEGEKRVRKEVGLRKKERENREKGKGRA
jgi:hypothetical protein